MEDKTIDENKKNENTAEILKILEKSDIKFFYFLPLIFIILIIPLIVHGKIIELPMAQADFWKGGIFHVDFFNYYKSTMFIIASCVSLLVFADLILNKKIELIKEKKYYIPMIIYVALVIISTMFSSDKNVSTQGFIEMYQGMSVLLSYILLLFMVMNLIKSKRDMKIVIYSISALTVIIGIIGIGQYFGYDFFQSQIGKWLITSKELKGANLNFEFGKFTIYATMYNTNFVGSFGALVLPIVGTYYLQEENKKGIILFYIATILAYSTWLGCNSRAGYIGIILSNIFALIIFRKTIKQKIRKILFLILGFFIITVIFNIASSGQVINQFIRLSPISEIDNMKKANEEQNIKFKEISIKENTFTIETTNEILIGTVENNELTFKDGESNQLLTNINIDGEIIFINKKYENYKIVQKPESKRIECNIYNRPLHLYITKENEIKTISFNNKLTIPIKAPSLKVFEGRETFASNRGYIWSRSIPLLKETIFIGYGPDNYCMVFPQEDYVGRFNTGSGMTDIVVDKPHNMYLQTSINTGVLSLIALLFIWGFYFVESIKLYINGKINSFEKYLGISVFLSVIGYLGAALFNDNVISITPLFWIILGFGIAINNMIKIDKLEVK